MENLTTHVVEDLVDTLKERILKPENFTSNLQYVVQACIASVIMYLIYRLFTPINIKVDLTELGYKHIIGKQSNEKKTMVNHARRRRKVGELPPVYPNGWFALAESMDLKKGSSKPVDALGKNYAVFRGMSGKIYIIDAYCPHLGAHLAVGSRVIGECVECPFHGWKFSGKTGKCTEIPYEEKVPSVAKIETYHSYETNGLIFVWHHAEGQDPYWYPEEVDNINSGAWPYRGRTEHAVNAHIQEIPENGGDVSHLSHLHIPLILNGTDPQEMWKGLNLARHKWGITWSCGQEEHNKHKTSINIKHEVTLFDKFDILRADVHVEQIGPGIVHLEGDCLMGKFLFTQTVTPVGEMTQRVIHRIYSQPRLIQPLAAILLLSEKCQAERDIVIWNNKMYKNKPVLVPLDENIKKFRQWYKQFYSENSPTLSFHKDGLEW